MRLIDADKLECACATMPHEASDDYKQGYLDGFSHSFEIIDEQPTITIPQWIPVGERLPEVGRNVLLSVGKGSYTAEGFLKNNGTWAQYRWSANLKNVDAWAEMPEPWRGEEDDNM